MKKIILPLVVLALLIGAGITFALTGNKLFPVVKNFGPVFDVPFAVAKPDSTMQYKIVADCGVLTEKPYDKPDEMYGPLQHIARMYNLHIYGGVRQENLEVDVVIWGDPISIILNNETYRKMHGVDNPNLKIISELKQAGVKFYACGQTIAKFGIDPATVNPDVTIAISRFTTVSTLQMKGFACFKF